MARARITSRMEKFVYQNAHTVAAGGDFFTSWQLDGGEVEAQVKRIMCSISATPGEFFSIGLFQVQPVLADFDIDEAIVISGSIGNQCWHNETITMRVPKGWYIGLKIHNFHTANNLSVVSLQLNYKVLN